MALQAYMPALQGSLGIRRPRNKYRNVAESYLSYCKKRKRRASRTRMLKRRMIKLLEKLLSQGMGSIASTVLYSDIHRITRKRLSPYAAEADECKGKMCGCRFHICQPMPTESSVQNMGYPHPLCKGKGGPR